ncbi:MAG: aminotransferase class I/II-fold pyridoxal phosphate-dependent enzyme [Candidatus Shapirobacteria bacterium]
MKNIINLSRNDYFFDHCSSIDLNITNSDISFYQPQANQEFYTTLANFHSISPQCLYIDNGLEKAFTEVFKSYNCFKSNHIIVPSISWEYYFLLANNSKSTTIHLLPNTINQPINFLSSESIRILNNTPSALVIVPWVNNPTGLPLANTKNELEKLVLTYPQHVFFFDMAYLGFNSAPYQNPCILSLITYPNVVIGFTFSKFFGTPGIRLGYLVANQKLLFKLNLKPNYLGINTSTLKIGSQLLINYSHYQNIVTKIKLVKDDFTNNLSNKGYNPILSESNFVLVDCKNNYESVISKLISNNFIVKTFSASPLRSCLRITIATEPIMNQVLNCF